MQILLWLSIGLDRRTPSEHLLIAIAEALVKKGHKVHVLQKATGGNLPELPKAMSDLGVTTTSVKSNPTKRSNLIGRYLEDIKYFLKCKDWLINNKHFDKVFLQSSNAAGVQVAILRRVLLNSSITFNVQDIFPENAIYSGTLSPNGIPYKLLSSIQKYGYKYVDHIITISDDMMNQLKQIGVPSDKIETIYNWSYQDDPYDRESLDYTRIAQLIDNSKFNVVYAGNIGRMQNVEAVILVADKLRDYDDIAFHIIGTGVYREKLEKLAKNLRTNNVVFHEMMGSIDAPSIYAYADVNIIPLAKNIYKTALPSKTATCLACGSPLVFAIGSESVFGNLLKAETGIELVDPDDIDGLQKAILKIKSKRTNQYLDDYYMKHFSRSVNSNRYAELIIG